ncbi:MAG TPA: DUF3788 family protein [Anaerolineales bacterium]
MNKRPFIEKTRKPTDKTMQSALGATYNCYKKVIEFASSYSKEWTFSKSSGWMQKIFDQKKALLYIIPLDNSFKISLTIREKEREAFLNDKELQILHEKISSSKKYPEGFALQIDINNGNEFQPAELLISKIIEIRK